MKKIDEETKRFSITMLTTIVLSILTLALIMSGMFITNIAFKIVILIPISVLIFSFITLASDYVIGEYYPLEGGENEEETNWNSKKENYKVTDETNYFIRRR